MEILMRFKRSCLLMAYTFSVSIYHFSMKESTRSPMDHSAVSFASSRGARGIILSMLLNTLEQTQRGPKERYGVELWNLNSGLIKPYNGQVDILLKLQHCDQVIKFIEVFHCEFHTILVTEFLPGKNPFN